MLPNGNKFTTTRIASLVFLLLWAFLSLMPMLWMVSTSLKPVTSYLKMPPEIVPSHPTLSNYADLLKNAPHWWRWVLNSVIVTSVVTGANLLFCSMAGYAFAKKRFPGAKAVFWAIVMSMMIPQQVTLIPLYQVTVRLGLYDNFGGLCIPFLSTAFGIFLMKQFSETISTDMLDAGRIDGCSELGLFVRVVLPLVKPALAVLGIFTVMWQWNDFLWPLVITNSSEMRTLQVGLATLQSKWSTDYGTLMAGAGLSALPMIAVFLAFQRYFIQGLRLGALKG
jgi:multiple sugar transport system permease protein